MLVKRHAVCGARYAAEITLVMAIGNRIPAFRFTANCNLPTAICQLPTGGFGLLVAVCLLAVAEGTGFRKIFKQVGVVT